LHDVDSPSHLLPFAELSRFEAAAIPERGMISIDSSSFASESHQRKLSSIIVDVESHLSTSNSAAVFWAKSTSFLRARKKMSPDLLAK
jgi:hypothetical protein